MEADLSFLDNDAFENATQRDIMDFAVASLTFKQHRVVTTAQASLLFKLGFLKMNTVDKPYARTEPFQYVWLTSAAEDVISEMMKSIGVSASMLKSVSDPIEDDISDDGLFTKFLMHRSRLDEELNASWDRVEEVVKRYAVWF